MKKSLHLIRLRRWLQLRLDCDSTVVRLPFDCNSTELRPFDDYVTTVVVVGCCTISKQVGVTAASGLHHRDLNDLWQAVERPSNRSRNAPAAHNCYLQLMVKIMTTLKWRWNNGTSSYKTPRWKSCFHIRLRITTSSDPPKRWRNYRKNSHRETNVHGQLRSSSPYSDTELLCRECLSFPNGINTHIQCILSCHLSDRRLHQI